MTCGYLVSDVSNFCKRKDMPTISSKLERNVIVSAWTFKNEIDDESGLESLSYEDFHPYNSDYDSGAIFNTQGMSLSMFSRDPEAA
jgi:hypothetical protein